MFHSKKEIKRKFKHCSLSPQFCNCNQYAMATQQNLRLVQSCLTDSAFVRFHASIDVFIWMCVYGSVWTFCNFPPPCRLMWLTPELRTWRFLWWGIFMLTCYSHTYLFHACLASFKNKFACRIFPHSLCCSFLLSSSSFIPPKIKIN